MVPDEDADPFAMQTVAVAQLINLWADYDDRPVYFAYVTAAEPAAGLEAIASPPPEESVELNWLNVFYAVEWAVFAGFAIFLWYRLVRDAVERERDEAAEEADSTRTRRGRRGGGRGIRSIVGSAATPWHRTAAAQRHPEARRPTDRSARGELGVRVGAAGR